MSTEVTYSRKATFTVSGAGEHRIFTPVNKRAKTVVLKAGKRKKVSVEDLRALVGKGSYTFHAYTKTGALKAISL